jgi:hypothetical protein
MDSPVLDYAQTLRVVGQVLEAVDAEAYDVVRHANRYLVRCKTKQSQRPGLSLALRMWRRTLSLGGVGRRPSMNVETLYTLADILRLDEKGKEKRRDPRGNPDPFSVSSVLRATGDFINRKGNCRLLLVSSRDHRSVAVLFETPQGVRKVEEYSLSSFYEYWVEMYVRRKTTTAQRAETSRI